MNDGTTQEQDQTPGEQETKQDETKAAKFAREQHDKRRDFHRWQELFTMALMGASMNQNEAAPGHRSPSEPDRHGSDAHHERARAEGDHLNMSDKKKDKPKKPAAEKKQRAPRTPMRTYQESPAGHFADKVMAHSKALEKIATKTATWGVPKLSEVISFARVQLSEALHTLVGLDASHFKPERKKGGGGLAVTKGMRVYLREEALVLLEKNLPDIRSLKEFYISVSADDLTAKMHPVRAGTADLNGRWIGMISKKLLSANPVTPA